MSAACIRGVKPPSARWLTLAPLSMRVRTRSLSPMPEARNRAVIPEGDAASTLAPFWIAWMAPSWLLFLMAFIKGVKPSTSFWSGLIWTFSFGCWDGPEFAFEGVLLLEQADRAMARAMNKKIPLRDICLSSQDDVSPI